MIGFIGSFLLLFTASYGLLVMVGAISIAGTPIDRLFSSIGASFGRIVRGVVRFVAMCASVLVRISVNRFFVWRRARRMQRR